MAGFTKIGGRGKKFILEVRITRRQNDKRGGLMNAARCDIMGSFDEFKERRHFTDSEGHALRITG